MKMEPQEGPKSRILRELTRLREQIGGIQALVPDPEADGLEGRSEQMIRLPGMLDDGPLGIAVLDPDHRCLQFNRALAQILGYADDDLAGVSLPNLAHEQDVDECVACLEQVARGVVLHGRTERRFFRKSGELLWLQLVASAIRPRDEDPCSLLVLIDDVTERKCFEQVNRMSEERYRELFENASDVFYTLDLEGNLTSINKAVERLTQYSRAEVLDMKFSQLAAPDCVDVARRLNDPQAASDGPATCQLDILTRDGRRVTLEINTRPIFREGKAVGVQGIARDITERKKAEQALQHAKERLEAWVTELEQRTREMTVLSEMADVLRACLSPEEAYTVIVRVAQQIFPVEVGALYEIAPSRNLVEAVAVWGNTTLAERVFLPGECWALRRGRTHWVEDTRVGLVCKHLHSQQPAGYLCVPMMAQSEALGVVCLTQTKEGAFTEAKQRLAVAMAEHIALALSNLKLHETLRSQSIRDPLTGLFNRRFMEESLELELRRAARNQRSLGVIMLDLDRFKEFNDSFGHDAGDTLLKELGKLLRGNVRAEDIACRYGGEEFTLILPEGSAEITQIRAGYLGDAIKNLDVQYRSQPLGRITVSMGVAVYPEHGRTGEALLQAADAALYRSKHEGRNRITVAK